MLKRLCVAGARHQFLLAKNVSTVWANLVLEQQDAVLTKVKDSIPFESFMDLRSSPLIGSSELFPADAIEKAVEKPACKYSKKLHFSRSTRPQQAAKHPSLPTSGKSSGHPPSSGSSFGYKASSTSSHRGKGKKF